MTGSSSNNPAKTASFSFRTLRFEFGSDGAIDNATSSLGNILRGAFGTVLRRMACECGDGGHRAACTYARIFEPRRSLGPSGFANPPRPFVLRPRAAAEGGGLGLDVHLFDLDDRLPRYFVQAFSQLAQEGMGPQRSRLTLQRAQIGLPISLSLSPCEADLRRATVEFRTPTELKADGVVARNIPFKILFIRARDRISALSSLYAGVNVDFDFKAMGRRAEEIQVGAQELNWQHVERRSSRTLRRHEIGGFTGWAEYQGDLREFLPWLQAGHWTGVGRQTVWGKGEILCRF